MSSNRAQSLRENLAPSPDDIFLNFDEWFSMWCDERSQDEANFNVEAMKATFGLFLESDAEQPWNSFRDAARRSGTTFHARAFQLIDELALQGEYNKLLLKKKGDISPPASPRSAPVAAAAAPASKDPVPNAVVAPVVAPAVVAVAPAPAPCASAPVVAPASVVVVSAPVAASPAVAAAAAPSAVVEAAPYVPVYEDAWAYLNGVKKSYPTHTQQYKTFLRILSEFKAQKLSQVEVETQVKLLFQHDRDLLEGFQLFLPKKKKDGDAAPSAPPAPAAPVASAPPAAPLAASASSPSPDKRNLFRVVPLAKKQLDANHSFMHSDRMSKLSVYNGDAIVLAKNNVEVVLQVFSDDSVGEGNLALSAETRQTLAVKVDDNIGVHSTLHNVVRMQSVTLKPLHDNEELREQNVNDIVSKFLDPFFQNNYYPVQVGSVVYVPGNNKDRALRFRVEKISGDASQGHAIDHGLHFGKYGLLYSGTTIECLPVETLAESKDRLSAELVSPYVPVALKEKGVHVLVEPEDSEGFYSAQLLNYTVAGALINSRVLQILETNDKSAYIFFRVDGEQVSPPQHFSYDLEGKNSCKAAFMVCYFKFTGNQWLQRSMFVPKADMYWPIELDGSMEEKHVAAREARAAAAVAASKPAVASSVAPAFSFGSSVFAASVNSEHEVAAPTLPPSLQPFGSFNLNASQAAFPPLSAGAPPTVKAFSPAWSVQRDWGDVPYSVQLLGNTPETACKYKVLQLIKKPMGGRYVFALWTQEGKKEPDAAHVAAPYSMTTFPASFLDVDQEAIDTFKSFFASDTGRTWDNRFLPAAVNSLEADEMAQARWKVAPANTPLILVNLAGKDSAVDPPGILPLFPAAAAPAAPAGGGFSFGQPPVFGGPKKQLKPRAAARFGQPAASFVSGFGAANNNNGAFGVNNPFQLRNAVPGEFPPYSPEDFEDAGRVASKFSKYQNNLRPPASAPIPIPSAAAPAEDFPHIPGGANFHPALKAFQAEYEESQAKALDAEIKLQEINEKQAKMSEENASMKRELESLRAENSGFRRLIKQQDENAPAVNGNVGSNSQPPFQAESPDYIELLRQHNEVKATLQAVLMNDELNRLQSELKIMTEKYQNLIWTVQVEQSLKERNLINQQVVKPHLCFHCQGKDRLEKMHKAVSESEIKLAPVSLFEASSSSSSSSSSVAVAAPAIAAPAAAEPAVVAQTPAAATATSSSAPAEDKATSPIVSASTIVVEKEEIGYDPDFGVVAEAESFSAEPGHELEESTLGEAASFILANENGWDEQESDEEWDVKPDA